MTTTVDGKKDKTYDVPYVLLKPDGTISAPNVYSAISRLAGHYGGHIVQAALVGAYRYDGSSWVATTQKAALAALLPRPYRPYDKQGDTEPFDVSRDWEERS